MGTLEISLLGGFQLRRDGVPLEPIPRRAARSLLAYLVMNRDRPHTRDLLAGTFWPDLSNADARRRLSQALWQVHRSVAAGEDPGRRLLAVTHDTVRISPQADLWLDVEEFERALDNARPGSTVDRDGGVDALAAALRLYRGDLLEGMYDDWALPERERLRERFLGALERLTNAVMSRGDYETAWAHARRLALHDPLREEAHQRVMRLAVLLGRHNDAIRQYELCCRVLWEELGAKPSPVTQQIYEAVLAERESVHLPRVLGPGPALFELAAQVPFVGREQERSIVARWLDEALASHGGLLLLEGEPGVGKTRLLAEAAGDARWRGMDVIWGRSPPNGGRPYAPVAEALGSGLSELRARQLAGRLEPAWREPLTRLVPPLALQEDGLTVVTLRPADEPTRMREALVQALLGLADIAPLLVVLEDIHWADEDTMQVLANLAGRTDTHQLALAVSYRHAEARDRPDLWTLLRDLDGRPSCTRLSLGPCSPAQTEELVRQCLGVAEVAAVHSQRIHRETGGVALLIMETLRNQYGTDYPRAAEPSPPERPEARDVLPATSRAHALMSSRLAGLSSASRSLLNLLSVNDGELTLSEIVAADGRGDEVTLQALDDLIRRRLVIVGSVGYRSAHELLRRVVYEALTPSARLRLHRQVALAVEAHRPDQVELLAHHFATARIPDRAAAYLEQAADRALAVGAYDTAAMHLGRATHALNQIAAPPERRFRVARRQEEVLDVLGRRVDQEAALAVMEESASAATAAEVHRRRALWLAHLNRFAEAEGAAQQALERARATRDSGQTLAALSTLGFISCFAGRAAEGVTYLETAAAFRGASPRQQADARNALGQNLIDLQRFDEAEPQLLAALALYEEVKDPRGEAEVLGMLGTTRMERGQSDLAEADFSRAIQLSRAIGYRHGEAVNQMNLGILLGLNGRPGAAARLFEEAAQIFTAIGNRRGNALVLSNAAWLRHAVLGDDPRAEHEIRLAEAVYRDIGDIRGQAQCLATLGSLRCRTGHTQAGLALLQQSLAMAKTARDWWIGSQIHRELARHFLEAGMAEVGLTHTDAALRACLETGMGDLAVSVGAIHSLLLLAAGQAEQALTVAVETTATARPGIELAYLVPYARGLALSAVGRIDESDRYLQSAHDQLITSLGDLSAQDRQTALRNVPTHRQVVEAWERRRPRLVERRLARQGVPRGRTLTGDEFVQVSWTVWMPADDAVDDSVERRRRSVLRLLHEAAAQGATATVADLSAALGVSVATIRRDLAASRRSGHAALTRGARRRPPE